MSDQSVSLDELELGMEIEVTHVKKRPSNDPEVGWEEVERTDVGTVTAVPSRKFNWEIDDFDFDYQLQRNGREGATRSVDIENEKVCQLHYDAGGDRDWDTFTLKSITRPN